MASAVIPCLRYRDAARMIDWLCEAFGFVRHAVHPDADGVIAHAELTLGGGMIMVGEVREGDAFGKLQSTPQALGGTTQSAYLIVHDVDAVHGRAVAAGAEIVMPLEDHDYGGRGFSCRDPQGQLWSVGSYDPWRT